LSANLDSFYASITNDHIEEMGVVGGMKWQVFLCVQVEHFQMVSPEAYLSSDVTNSSQPDGQIH